jgi:hypothetical protein
MMYAVVRRVLFQGSTLDARPRCSGTGGFSRPSKEQTDSPVLLYFEGRRCIRP